MASKKFYAVRRGKKPGIYTSWPECQKQVAGFANARFKGFMTREEALAWLQQPEKSKPRAVKHATQTSLDLFGEEQGPRFIPTIVFYTDGGSRNRGNRRGDHVHQDDLAAWAYLIRFEDGLKITDTAGEFGATNNRMEVMGLLKCLQRLLELNLQNEPIEGILDSQYVLNAINKGWLYSWVRRGWKTSGGKPVANQELWAEVSVLLPKFKQLRFKWTKGHANSHGNVTVDQLLNSTMDNLKA